MLEFWQTPCYLQCINARCEHFTHIYNAGGIQIQTTYINGLQVNEYLTNDPTLTYTNM